MPVFGIRTWSDLRAFLHVFLPVLAVAAVSSGLLTQSDSLLWVGLASAVADPALSFGNSDGFRRWFYGVALAANAVLIGVFGLWTPDAAAPWFALIPILLGGGVAAANTPTSTA
jgi:hypothetical protein